MPVTFGSLTFSSQIKAKDYIRTLLHSIGYTTSVKDNTNTFNLLQDIVNNHPNKLYSKDIIDFEIGKDLLSGGYTLSIVKSTETICISWYKCVTGKQPTLKQELNGALRQSISYQIWDFKKSAKQICELCSAIDILHVDHIVHFEKLVQDFHSENNFPLPTEFIEVDDGTYRRGFTINDKKYEDAWTNYHKRHATLRILCKKCNLSRPHYNGSKHELSK